jgi:NTE family protein
MDLTLALGGGGVKGIAHIGVLKVFENEGFRIRAIAGTSAGGLIGALYASGYRAEEIESILKSVNQSKLYGRRSEDGPSLLGLAGLASLLVEVLGERTFNDLEIPLAVTAVDIKTGQEVVLHHGKLVDATLATTAVPGVFPPRTIGAITLMDGGVLDPVPVSVSRWMAPELPVVAVTLNDPPEKWTTQPASLSIPLPIPAPAPIMERVSRLRLAQAFNIFIQSVEYSSRLLSEMRLEAEKPNVVIRPDVSGIHWLDQVDIPSVVQAGEQAALKALPDLRKTLSWPNRLARRMRRTFGDGTVSVARHDL